jgi:hypothetical protein
MAKYDDGDGVWRTIGGRRVFIRTGQSVSDAMKESGKFKKGSKSQKENKKFTDEDEAFIQDLTEHYDEFTRGDLQGTIEAKYGMGEKGQAILKEVDDRTYEKYKVDTLNNDEYLQANRSNEYFQKVLNENNQSSNIKVKGENNIIPKDFKKGYGKFKVETNSNKGHLDDRYEITKDEYGEYHAKNLRTGETYATFGSHLRNNNVFEFENNEKSTNEIMNNNIKEKSGYSQYLRDRYGTENEDIVSTGYKSKKDLYQEYKNEVIRNINNKRMEKGTTSLEQAYKKAFQEYKKLHPNTKLNLQGFIKMSEE